jgi:hypothetical protein
MEITKKHWTIIGVVIAVIAVWYFFLRKKKTESSYRIKSKVRGQITAGSALKTAGTEICCNDNCTCWSIGKRCNHCKVILD